MLLVMGLVLDWVYATLATQFLKYVRLYTISIAAGTYTDENINITSDNLTITGAGVTTIFDVIILMNDF